MSVEMHDSTEHNGATSHTERAGIEPMLERRELGRGTFVEGAPIFASQLGEPRPTGVLCVRGLRNTVPTHPEYFADDPDYAAYVGNTPEHDILAELKAFLNKVHESGLTSDTPSGVDEYLEAKAIYESLTWMGPEEVQKFTRYMAQEWRAALDADPNKIICLTDFLWGNADDVKSGMFIVDLILEHFGQDLLRQYADRIVPHPREIKVGTDPSDVDLLVVDDCMLKGISVSNATRFIIEEYPEYANRIRIRLLVSPRKWIEQGVTAKVGESVTNIPVDTYYLANDSDVESEEGYAPERKVGARIAFWYGRPDFGYRDSMAGMIARLHETVPAALTVVSPYKREAYVPVAVRQWQEFRAQRQSKTTTRHTSAIS